ncbi:MAG: SpoIIE family protein phosphatase, partial [Bacteroidales bacterium]|nr:SpoIIE family protein phosphatase [Bacteroidales bacterium]
FAEGRNGHIWVGTEGQGVFVIDRDKVLDTLNTKNGLLSNLIQSLNTDNAGNIYIASNKGLNMYNVSQKKIFTYTQKNGFVGIEAKKNATLKDHNGHLWFGTANGATRFNPQLAEKSLIDPQTHITAMRVNDDTVAMVPNLKLKHNQNSIVFDFISISLINPDAVIYKVKLEGFDKDWYTLSNQQNIKYSALPTGRYTFKVMAKNTFGIWNENPIEQGFYISPPFYSTWWFILSCAVAVTLLVFSYIKLRERNLRRENKLLEEKVEVRTREVTQANARLEETNVELKMKNKDITDSIRYAQRIQLAILPSEIPFKDTFVLFRPKDIVSGDFYWMTTAAGKEIFTAVDCTGHGVPGAFMSFIGYSSLNKIVKEHKVFTPADILEQLNLEVTMALNEQGRAKVSDGMDLALVAYDPQTQTLEYAGAYNPLIIIRNGEILETKGNRFSIGHSAVGIDKEFINHKLKIESGDSLYIFSDGYADQFGGPDKELKKFKIKTLKNLLVEIARHNINKQKEVLESTLDQWKGSTEQIDDILIIGRKF